MRAKTSLWGKRECAKQKWGRNPYNKEPESWPGEVLTPHLLEKAGNGTSYHRRGGTEEHWNCGSSWHSCFIVADQQPAGIWMSRLEWCWVKRTFGSKNPYEPVSKNVKCSLKWASSSSETGLGSAPASSKQPEEHTASMMIQKPRKQRAGGSDGYSLCSVVCSRRDWGLTQSLCLYPLCHFNAVKSNRKAKFSNQNFHGNRWPGRGSAPSHLLGARESTEVRGITNTRNIHVAHWLQTDNRRVELRKAEQNKTDLDTAALSSLRALIMDKIKLPESGCISQLKIMVFIKIIPVEKVVKCANH